MTSLSQNRTLAISQNIFEQLLRLYPQAHRNEYGRAMAQLFRDQSRAAWGASRGWGLAILWLRTLPDLGKTSLIERMANLNPKKSMTDKMSSLFRPTPLATFFGVFTIVFFLVLITSVAVTFILPESYSSTARMMVEPDSTSNSSVTQSSVNKTYDPYFIQTTFEVMQSAAILDDVITALDLNAKWGKKYNNGEKLKTDESAAILKGSLVLAPVRNTSLIAVTVYSDDPKEAAQIANATVDAYKNFRIKNAAVLAETSLHKLQQEFRDNETQVEQTRAEVSSIGSQLNVGSVIPANLSPQEQAYWDRKRYLDGLLETHKTLYAKIETAKIDVQIPYDPMVQIVDRAEPGKTPVKPNKPLNIFIGAVAGGFAGLLVGAVSAFAAAKWSNRRRKNSVSV